MTKLQAAIERVRNRFSWVVCDTDAGTALLAVLAAAEKVPALEARLAEAEVNAARYEALRYAFSYDSLSGWFNDEPTPEAETDAIVEAMMHEAADLRPDGDFVEKVAAAEEAESLRVDAERYRVTRGRCSIYENLCSNEAAGDKVDEIADEFIAEARARQEADRE